MVCHEQGISSGTQISGISSGINETCRASKKYAKERGERLSTGKERAERKKSWKSEGRAECLHARM